MTTSWVWQLLWTSNNTSSERNGLKPDLLHLPSVCLPQGVLAWGVCPDCQLGIPGPGAGCGCGKWLTSKSHPPFAAGLADTRLMLCCACFTAYPDLSNCPSNFQLGKVQSCSLSVEWWSVVALTAVLWLCKAVLLGMVMRSQHLKHP